MQLIDGRPVYSATDLVAFLACEALPQLERAALEKLVQRPVRDDPELEVIRRRGFQHEQRYLDGLRDGRRVVTIDPDGYDADRATQLRMAAGATLDAMAGGADVIYQATFFDGRWRGHADFLLRVDDPDRPSRWGAWHYEVADTKLARHVKASALLQICSYVDQLERLQGVRPEQMHVALGGSGQTVARFRVDDFMAYYRSVKARFEASVSGAAALPVVYPLPTAPEPVEHCEVCRWAELCDARRRADDHLSLVAGITARQRSAVRERGIATLEGLAEAELPFEPPLEGTSETALERVRDQARLQLRGRRERRPLHELLLPAPGEAIDPERGLATLPPPSPGDVFFDIEGDPFALDDGIDYLFGVLDTSGAFRAFWAVDPSGAVTHDAERHAFESFVDFVMARLEADPGMHVYHYAPYEPTALKRLMGRYGTREDEVDRLLRGGVLVDLYRAVRQGVRASVESYSIKKLERFYGFEREVDLRDAGSSIVAFEQWLELGEGERPEADHLQRIEGYNRDDVISNARLRDWLEALRDELAERTGQPVPRPAPRDGRPTDEQSATNARVQALVDRLTAGISDEPTERSEDEQGRWLLAQLLGWHRREDKSTWWEFFARLGLDDAGAVEDGAALGGLVPLEPLEISKSGRKQTWRYRFAPQDHDVRRGSDVYDPARHAADPGAGFGEWRVGTVVAVDEAARTIDIQRDVAKLLPHPSSVVPLQVVRTGEQQEALVRLGQWVAEHGLGGYGDFRAARELLLARPPRVGQEPGAPLRRAAEADLAAARRLALTLDESTLAVQGPPGSGKTYTGARMIVSLLAQGRKVGITATSHKVICNLLAKTIEAAEAEGVEVRAVQRANEPEDACQSEAVKRAATNAGVLAALDEGANLVAGTAWLWSPLALADSVDVLFVDEAGQISLANVLAIAGATRSIVLLGDPQQLEQPLQGTHPPGAERSALGHVLQDSATIEPDRGLFLGTTWRLHPDICAFTSEQFYDDRLDPENHLRAQELEAAEPLGGTGLRFLPVPHAGNDNEAAEEAGAVANLARSLVEGGATWIDDGGHRRRLSWRDVLIVAPYNAQVGAIRRRLPGDARVGTVDKFQGQEGAVSVYSLTTSSPAEAPRGMDFLYSRNRLNVATSRARCVAIVAASPDLLLVHARTPEQMRLANALCRFVELAVPIGAPNAPPAAQLVLPLG